MNTPEEIRKKIDRLITENGLNYRTVSKQLGRADSYIQQYITRGYLRSAMSKQASLMKPANCRKTNGKQSPTRLMIITRKPTYSLWVSVETQ